MSKKRFTDGFEQFFDLQRAEEENASAFETEQSASKTATAAVRPRSGRPSSAKNFSGDLKSFFDEVFEEERAEGPESEPAKPAVASANKKRSHKPLGGLDSLLQSTVDPQEELRRIRRPTRRVSVTLDEEKLEKIKEIARQEKTHLRSLFERLVSDYIEQYQKHKPQE